MENDLNYRAKVRITPSLPRVTKEKIQQNIQLSWEGIRRVSP